MIQINAYEEDAKLEIIHNIICNNQYHTNISNTKQTEIQTNLLMEKTAY